jgi:hypothetical protein
LPKVNLGSAFWLRGRYDEAVQVLLEGLAERVAEYGSEDRESFM